MGLIVNKTAIIASALTAAALYFKLEPLYAFLIGAIILSTPIRLLLPGSDKKVISETAIMSALGVILAFTTLKFSFLHTFVFGVAIGYAYVLWWIIVLPKILSKK